MRYTVKINRQASRDLTEIFQYIEDREQSPVPVEKFTNALVDVAMGLAQFPYRGHVIKRRRKARRLVHGNYLIIFRNQRKKEARGNSPFFARCADEITRTISRCLVSRHS